MATVRDRNPAHDDNDDLLDLTDGTKRPRHKSKTPHWIENQRPWLAVRLHFGKYVGQTVEEIWHEHSGISWLEWALREANALKSRERRAIKARFDNPGVDREKCRICRARYPVKRPVSEIIRPRTAR